MRETVLRFVAEGGTLPLRQLQEKVMWEHDLVGDDWKKVSALIRGLVRDGVLSQVKKGRHFYVSAGPRWAAGVGDVMTLPLQLLDEHGGLRVSAETGAPDQLMQYLVQRFQAGDLDMVFVPHRARTVGYQVARGEPTVRLPHWDDLNYRQDKGHAEDVI